MSSNRFKNSGLNTVLFRLESCRFVLSVVGDCAKSHHRLAFEQLGTYVEVMMIIVFRKSIVWPMLSVILPSSRI